MHKLYSDFNILVKLLGRFFFNTSATSRAISTISKSLFTKMRRKQIEIKAQDSNYHPMIDLFQHHKIRRAQRHHGLIQFSAPRDVQC